MSKPAENIPAIAPIDGLNPKQAAFVAHYCGDLADGANLSNATASAKAAGYSGTSYTALSSAGSRLLNNPAVARAIAERLARRLAVEGEAIRTALARLAMSDMSNFLSVDEAGKPSIDWTKALQAAAIGQIRRFHLAADGAVTIVLHDPRPALEVLAKIAGLYADHHVSQSVQFNMITFEGDAIPFDHEHFAKLHLFNRQPKP